MFVFCDNSYNPLSRDFDTKVDTKVWVILLKDWSKGKGDSKSQFCLWIWVDEFYSRWVKKQKNETDFSVREAFKNKNR